MPLGKIGVLTGDYMRSLACFVVSHYYFSFVIDSMILLTSRGLYAALLTIHKQMVPHQDLSGEAN